MKCDLYAMTIFNILSLIWLKFFTRTSKSQYAGTSSSSANTTTPAPLHALSSSKTSRKSPSNSLTPLTPSGGSARNSSIIGSLTMLTEPTRQSSSRSRSEMNTSNPPLHQTTPTSFQDCSGSTPLKKGQLTARSANVK
jgi:hypothetical protein